MGDAAGDVGPGGAALRGDELADVVERDHAPWSTGGIAGHAHVQPLSTWLVDVAWAC